MNQIILLTRHSLPISKMLVFTAATFLTLFHYVTATANVTSRTAPVGAKVLTVAVIGGQYTVFRQIRVLIECTDYGWTGWLPSPDNFCFDVLPKLEAAGITVPNEVINGTTCNQKQIPQNSDRCGRLRSWRQAIHHQCDCSSK